MSDAVSDAVIETSPTIDKDVVGQNSDDNGSSSLEAHNDSLEGKLNKYLDLPDFDDYGLIYKGDLASITLEQFKKKFNEEFKKKFKGIIINEIKQLSNNELIVKFSLHKKELGRYRKDGVQHKQTRQPGNQLGSQPGSQPGNQPGSQPGSQPNNTNNFDSNPTSHNDLFKDGSSYTYYNAYDESNPCLGHFARKRGDLRKFAIKKLNEYLGINSNPPELNYKLYKYSVIQSVELNSHTSKAKVNFREITEGDSVIEAVINGGVILNPANEGKPGGGVFKQRDMNAMEENLCRQSNLITQLLHAHQIITKGKGEDFRYLGISGDVTSQCAIITLSNFNFVKFGKGTSSGTTSNGEHIIYPGNFRKLQNDEDIPVLSIASPNMKKRDLSEETLSEYTQKMEVYWELAIKSTISYCKEKKIPSKLIAVMPGDFIKVNGTPNPDYARKGAEALKNVLLRLTPEIEIVFPRKTNETDICKDICKDIFDKPDNPDNPEFKTPYDWYRYHIKNPDKSYALSREIATQLVIFNEEEIDPHLSLPYSEIDITFQSEDEAKRVYDKLIEPLGGSERKHHTLTGTTIHVRIANNNPEVFMIEEIAKGIFDDIKTKHSSHFNCK
jgi:hypothetical protein